MRLIKGKAYGELEGEIEISRIIISSNTNDQHPHGQ